jgi:formate hydrogenlyase transcriptional activator
VNILKLLEKSEYQLIGDKPRRPVFVEVFFNILGSIRQPLLVLDYDLNVVKANRHYYMKFVSEPDQTEGQSLFDLGNRSWNIPRLKKLLEAVLRWKMR